MPVHFLASAVSSAIPTEYWASLAASLVAVSFLKTWSKGAKLLDPPPPRPLSKDTTAPPTDVLFADLHGRVVLIASGAFTPLGVVTISALAHRGAQIIALTPDISDPEVIQIIHLIRDSTQSELIYAEQCDLGSLESVSAFAALWNAGDKKQAEGVRRLDSLLFLPPTRDELERVQLGNSPVDGRKRGKQRSEAIYQLHVLARFHLVNSLLSSLLVLPREREIRIVSVLSPYYAAGLNHFDVLSSASSSSSPTSTAAPTKSAKTKAKGKTAAAVEPKSALQTLSESSYTALVGAASLRWHALTTELQRRLDLLAEADPRPRTKLPGIDVQHTTTNNGAAPSSATAQETAAQSMRQHSNISIINVCPGFERNTDIIETFFPRPSRPSSPPPPTEPTKKSTTATATILQTQLDQHTHPTTFTLSTVAFYLRSTLRFVVLLLLWPFVWLLAKSPASAADSVVWATTRKLEPLSARYHRLLTTSSPSAASGDSEARRWQDGLIPGEMYREGRIVRPQLPARFGGVDRSAWSELWKAEEEEVERRIKALGGEIKRPKL